MDGLSYELKQLCHHNRMGGRRTQSDRLRSLLGIAGELKELGFRLPGAKSLKPKHVEKLIAARKARGVTDASLKNTLSHLRTWAIWVNKPGLIPRENSELGIAPKRTGEANKAKKLDLEKVATVQDEHVRMALRLQAAFGLRKTEALLFEPDKVIQEGRIGIQRGTKGNRYREIPIHSEHHQALLEEARDLAQGGTLVPRGRTLKEHTKVYDRQTLQAGLKNNHGLRHHYAQWRYAKLSGMKAPLAGGKSWADMSPAERKADRQARRMVSAELGHNRLEVTNTYLGSPFKK